MKVVEKLFNNYLSIPPDYYVQKYLAAMSVLAITEKPDSKEIKEIHHMRDRISDQFPVSLFKATKFLDSKETRVSYNQGRQHILELNKSKGHDYRLRDHLGIFIERVNDIVVKSMSKYNTDRGRVEDDGEEIDFESLN